MRNTAPEGWLLNDAKFSPPVILSEDAPAGPARLGLAARGCRCASESKDPYAACHHRASGVSLRARLGLALALLIAVPALSQTADPFASLHARLNAAADDALAQPAAAVILSETAPQSVRAGFARAQGAVESKDPYSSTKTLAIARLDALRPTIEPLLKREGLPAGLAAVVLVESGGQLGAISPKGARGAWQIMPETARRYGLVVSATRDERLDLLKSTQAAARYLRDLYAQFGSWPLALAAYNAGEQAVQRALERTGSRDFAELSRALPLETRAYVPAVLSAFSSGKLFALPPSNSGRVVYAGMETVLNEPQGSE